MLRALWFILQVVAFTAIGVWIFNRPGTLEVEWLGYTVETQLWAAFVLLLVVFFIFHFFFRIMNALISLPRRWRDIQNKKRHDRGYRALTLGLSAVSAGDAKVASYQAYRMRQFLRDEKGLPWLLEAQAAKLRGDEIEARGYFSKLLENNDTAFLGVRGLLQDAVSSGDPDRALMLARQALSMHPGQSWIIHTVFGIEVQKREWVAALATLKKGERSKAWTADELKSLRIAVLLQQGDELSRAGFQQEAGKKYREANRIDPAFIPGAVRLACNHMDQNRRRNAVSVVERAWKENPHVDLVPVWKTMAPHAKRGDMAGYLRWFERLVALKPGDAESQIAAATAALEEGLWGEAWQFLSAAEKIRPSARLYRLWAQVEEKTGHAESARRYWEKAADAPGDKVWTCRETGRIYEHWSPVAEPHGAFNTIVWDDPLIRRMQGITTLPIGNTPDLLTIPA